MNTQNIKRLRLLTGAGVLNCQEALKATGGDFEKAQMWLRKKGLAGAGKKGLREARQGMVSSYLHGPGRIGVLVEVNVETDFAARGEDFKSFVHHLCLHIAASAPLVVEAKDLPEEVKNREANLFREQAEAEGKQATLIPKMVQGRLKKWMNEVCLMDQIFLLSRQTDKPQTVRQVLTELIARLGENVVIRRFVRFELGEEPGSAGASK